MSKKKLTKHIWYGSDTVMSEGKLQAAPPPVAIAVSYTHLTLPTKA